MPSAAEPLLGHVLDAVRAAGGTGAAVVVGPDADCGGDGSPARSLPTAEIFVQARAAGNRACGAGGEGGDRARAGRCPGHLRRYAADPRRRR